MSKIILPRTDEKGNYYISYSQHSKWKRSKKEYIKSYFLGEKFEGNAFTSWGSMIGEAIENNDFSAFTPKEKKVLKRITRLDEFEREIKLDMGDFYVMGFIDSNDKDLKILIDYKTGDMNKVEVYEADDYDQLGIYAAAIEQETGKLPEQAYVELIERKGNAFKGEELVLGTKIAQIPQDISPKKIKEIKKDITKVAGEISDFYKVFNLINQEIIQ